MIDLLIPQLIQQMRFSTLKLIVCSSAIFLTATSSAALIQWPISAGGNGNFYGITPTTMKWTEAEAFAVSLGGHLASIGDLNENQFLFNTFFSGPNNVGIAWIGFNDVASEGTFVWSSGDPVTFTRWAPGEPNNGAGNDYVNMLSGSVLPGSPGAWNDSEDFEQFVGLYELPASAVPEPGAMAMNAVIAAAFASPMLGRKRRRLS